MPGKERCCIKEIYKKIQAIYEPGVPNSWTARDREQRNDWWDSLSHINAALSYTNKEACPLCGKIESDNNLRRSLDAYRYCEECYEERLFKA